MRQPRHFTPNGPRARPQLGAGEEISSAGLPTTAVDAEHWVLTSDLGRELMAAVAQIASIGPADVARLRKLAPPPAVAAAIRLARGRVKARAKFERGGQMWVDDVGIEQSTSELVALHKSSRFCCPLVVDLCAGIGGDALAFARRADVLAVDRDRGMCRRIRYNSDIYNLSARILPIQSSAERFVVPTHAWVHLDPDRRAVGPGRAKLLEHYAPGLEFCHSLARQAQAGAIKLGPASDFARHFDGPDYEVELVSLRGECKEATAWFGAIKTGCRRRATRLPEQVTWTDHDAPAQARPAIAPVSTWIYDPDPSLLRAGLLDGFAVVHELGRVAPRVDYLTGDHLVNSAFLDAFVVSTVCPLDVRRLRRLVAANRIGTLEIKVRGVQITPESLRGRLDPRGDRSATLLVFGGEGPARAVLAYRASTGGSISSSTGDAAGASSTP